MTEQTTTNGRTIPLVVHLGRLAQRASDAALPVGDLRNRHLVALKFLGDLGPVGQQAIADALQLDPSNVVLLLNELEGFGLAVRRRDPADRRRHIVELSPAGRETLADAYSRMSAVEARLLGSLTEPEREKLYELLSRALGTAPSASCDVNPT
ncbi:MarR family winged helix-turn-helix transcriptional regulator [Actinoplanes sp. NPDC049265]|uniref:MarR family winged helix-turn-helix transcriptional regulator n=1 Tax=Actinoplanes sp. NPDC049265 TaxID=3363902 RepID=UPI00371DA05F